MGSGAPLAVVGDGLPLGFVSVGPPVVGPELGEDDEEAEVFRCLEVVGAAEVVGASEVVGAADVVGAGGFTGLLRLSPVMTGEVGSSSTGVPLSTAFMNAFQMWPGSPEP